MSERELVSLVEISIDFCARTYGAAPCTAALGTTGERKCFNTRPTCQDPANYAGAPKVLRFSINGDFIPQSYNALPFLRGVSTSPMQIAPGQDLGKRASAKATFSDHPYHDIGLDKYQPERISGAAQQDGVGYRPEKRGTFWGKFRARNAEAFLGRTMRVLRGTADQQPADMVAQTYVIESISGPDGGGTFTITGKDPLKLADGDRAQAPRASRGTLRDPLTAVAGTAVLLPAGIGDEEYPAAGFVAIGQEVAAFTRSADTLTLTERGALQTQADTHDAADTVQVVLAIESQRIDAILADLLVTYGNVPAQFINYAQWDAEAAAHMPLLYTAHIAEPTSVRELIDELTRQVGFNLWWDDVAESIELLALKSPPANADTIDEDQWIIAGTMRVAEQPRKRISDVWINYGLLDPTQRLDDANNYRNTLVSISALSRELNGGQPAIERIHSRWIGQFNRAAAEDVASKLLQRFARPPRAVAFAVPLSRFAALRVGGVYRITSRLLQGPDGGPSPRFWQITSVDRREDRVQVTAEEFGLSVVPNEGETPVHPLFIDNDVRNFNLRTAHDETYGAPVGEVIVECYIAAGVVVGSADTASPAWQTGAWPDGATLRLINQGRVAGAGGPGGSGYAEDSGVEFPARIGRDGGVGLRAVYALEVDNAGGVIAGGGGGGGGGGDPDAGGSGGGGAGDRPGAGGAALTSAGASGAPGTLLAGGAGGEPAGGPAAAGGDGGDPGQAGASATAAGGAAGSAIDGADNVTFTNAGSVVGPTTP